MCRASSFLAAKNQTEAHWVLLPYWKVLRCHKLPPVHFPWRQQYVSEESTDRGYGTLSRTCSSALFRRQLVTSPIVVKRRKILCFRTVAILQSLWIRVTLNVTLYLTCFRSEGNKSSDITIKENVLFSSSKATFSGLCLEWRWSFEIFGVRMISGMFPQFTC